MLHVDDGQLHAYLDGELALLGAAVVADLERHLADCAECQARFEEERAVRDRAHAILRGSGPGALEEPSFATLAARTPAPSRSASRRVRPMAALAWAASIVLALGLGWFGRELLRQPAEMRIAAESATAADRPAPATLDAPGVAPSAGDTPVEPARPARAVPRVQLPPAAPRSPAEAAADAPVLESALAEPALPAVPAGEAVAYGRVTDEAGAGIPDVSIYIPALDRGTLTRADGRYSLSIPADRLAASEELAITAARSGMRSDSQRLVVQPGQQVAADFELQPATPVEERIMVTGRTPEARLNRAAAAATAPPPAAAREVRWEPVDRAEAERRLGGDLRVVRGLRLVGITAAEEEGQPVIRTVQQLDGGAWLELLQRREMPAAESGFAARAASAHAELGAATAAPAVAGQELVTIEIRRDGYRITARAPLTADSLRVLLSQVQ